MRAAQPPQASENAPSTRPARTVRRPQATPTRSAP
jgi:hypothetical protein